MMTRAEALLLIWGLVIAAFVIWLLEWAVYWLLVALGVIER